MFPREFLRGSLGDSLGGSLGRSLGGSLWFSLWLFEKELYGSPKNSPNNRMKGKHKVRAE